VGDSLPALWGSARRLTLRVFFIGMAEEVLEHTVDLYGGVILNPDALIQRFEALPRAARCEAFTHALAASMAGWRALQRRGVWLRLPIALADLVHLAVDAGFLFHHAEPTSVTLTAWLPGGESTLPAGPTHQLGVGAFVVNSTRDRVLVVQEKRGPAGACVDRVLFTIASLPLILLFAPPPPFYFIAARPGFWKLPTGLLNQGEHVHEAAEREVLEETAIRAHTVGCVGFREAHGIAHGKDDLFFLVVLELDEEEGGGRGEPEPVPQESEIAAARWMPLAEFSEMPHLSDGSTVWGALHDLCRSWAAAPKGRPVLQGRMLPLGFRPGDQHIWFVSGTTSGGASGAAAASDARL
jgi:8-oxo-dGTP pyrophosphatase MutT (NUDIX family)